MQKPINVKDLKQFQATHAVFEIVDHYRELLNELFEIRNPWAKGKNEQDEREKFIGEHLAGVSLEEAGEWFFFPWNGVLVHYLPEPLHQEIRTARNKNLITPEEQKQLYGCSIAIAGLSVGSHGALLIAMMSIGHKLKLADNDTIAASNLNRLHYDFTVLGKNKAEVAAQHIYQMNPYMDIELYTQGVTSDNCKEFLNGTDVLIEEMDSLPLKVLIRRRASELGIPVLMATDNGTGVILDVERFDQNKQYPLFHGRVSLSEKDLSSTARETDPKLWNRVSSEIIGIEYMEEDLLNSLAQIGHTLTGVPQLAAAASISGGVLAIAASRIITGKQLVSGKYILSVDAIIDPGYNEATTKKQRNSVRAAFKQKIHS